MDSRRFEIDNATVISKLLPYFIRGRKVILFLEAIAHPLVSIHNAFLEWGVEKQIECCVTSQKDVLLWYLTHVFKKYFVNTGEKFELSIREADGRIVAYEDHVGAMTGCTLHFYAPAIFETKKYDNENYRKDISIVMRRYLTCSIPYEIDIPESVMLSETE